MSSNCVGRGRGWLNLNKSRGNSPGYPPQSTNTVETLNLCGRGYGWPNLNIINNSAPGNPPQPITSVGNPPDPIVHWANEDDISFVEYEILVYSVKMLDINDNRIKLNQKVKFLLKMWNEECSTSDEVESNFETLYQACLHDDELAFNMVFLISSRTFASPEVRGKNFRTLFLAQLKKTLDGSDFLHKSDPVAFRNCTRMLGEFFSRTKLGNGGSFPFLAAPLVVNLRNLLFNAQPEDLQLLATLLFKNGVVLRAECPDQFAKLLIDVRLSLASKELSKESKLWLQLCVDGASNKFERFSADLCTFYNEQIGEAAKKIIQGLSSPLRIRSNQRNKFLQSYRSDISVNKVCSVIGSETYQGYTSGSISDSSSECREGGSGQDDKPKLGWKAPSLNSRMLRKPKLSVEAMLSKCNIRTGSCSASDKENSESPVES